MINFACSGILKGKDMEILDELEACDNCAIAITNDDYTGMDDEEEEATREGIEELSKEGYLVVGDEIGFSNDECDISAEPYRVTGMR